MAEGFPAVRVKHYLENCGDVVYTKTHDRSILTQMNDFLLAISYEIEYHLPSKAVNMVELNKWTGRLLSGSLGYKSPIDFLRKALEEVT